MNASEIIAQNSEQLGMDPREAVAAIAGAIKNKVAFLLQQNDSVLYIKPISEVDAEIHLFTMDSPLVLAKSISYFFNILKKGHYKNFYIKENNPQIIELLKRVGVPVQHSDKPEYNWKATGA